MLKALIRLTESQEIDASGESLEEVHALLEEHRPEGFDLIKAPVAMSKSGGQITAVGTYHRRDTLQEITAPTMAELEAAVPDGWVILHVQTVG